MASNGAGLFNNAAGDASGAVSSLFAGYASQAKAGMYRTMAQADLLRGQGDLLEGENYGRASALALRNEEYTRVSTAISAAGADRALYMATGAQRAAGGASGLQSSGSELDILADSARQGAVQKQALEFQGLVTEEGYKEQSDTYLNMQKAAGLASDAEKLASQGHMQAADAEDTAAEGNFFAGGIKGIAAIANIALMFA